nr:1162_t:CDS:2 [Entrophospora candida]CAG8536768.1 12226_t:CDS:2 [Entrophospora candida]
MNPLLLQSRDEQPTQILEYSTLQYIDPRSLDMYQTSQTFTDPLSSHIDPITPIRRHKRKRAQTTRPYEKRTHALVACDSCRKLRLRCEKKEDSDFCVRCIDRNKEDCIFNQGRKRGRKPGSKNKQKF